MAGRLAGEVAIITGASRGLGQWCAVGNGREGATVVVAARTETDPRDDLSNGESRGAVLPDHRRQHRGNIIKISFTA